MATPPPPSQPDPRRLRRLLVLVSAIVLVDTMFYAAIAPLLPHYAREFGLTKTAAGLLTGAYPAGALLGTLPGGLLAARAGVKPTIVAGLACMVGASVVFALAPGVVVLDAARFIQGAGGAASWSGALAWLVAAAPRERRGALLGTALAAAILGALLGPVLGGAANAVGPRTAFLAVAVLGAGLALAAVLTPGAPAPLGSRLADAARALRDPRLVGSMWLITLPGLLFGVISVLVPLRLDALGGSGTLVAAVFLVAAGLEAAVSPLAGRLSDRRGRRAPVLAGLAGGAVVIALFPAPSALGVLVALVLLASPVIGILWAPATALVSDGAEAAGVDQALGFALMNGAWAIGQFTGSTGGGALAQATSDAVPYLILTATCAATFVIAARRGAGGMTALLRAPRRV